MATPNGSGLSQAQVYAPPQRKSGPRVPILAWIVLVLAAAAGGYFVGSGGGLPQFSSGGLDAGALAGKTVITEKELDAVMGTYVLDGETYEVTARDALAQQSSLEVAQRSDGNYAMPSAESVLAAARTAVLMREVESREITVSDEELASYLDTTFGTQDVASLASAYSMDEETARARLKESAAIAKLRAEVVNAPGDAPSEPAAPDEDDPAAPTEDYATYIIALVGDEWDAEADTWAADDGPYATALHDYDVSKSGATYDAASTAYNVAYQLYGNRVSAAETQWTDFVNALLSQAKVAVCTLGT